MTFLHLFILVLILASAAAAQEVVTKTTAITDIATVLAEHKGKPLLVNVWATWCGPCRVEFPTIIKTADDFRGKGLETALVSLDNFGAADSDVADFLKSYDSTATSYLFDGRHSRLYAQIRKIAPKAPPGVPLTLLFRADGRVAYVKSGVVNGDVLRANVIAILAPAPTK